MKQTIKAAFLIVLLTVGLAEPIVAGPLEDGYAAYKRSDFKTALRLWRPLAEHGSAEAQTNLGNMYRIGQGVRQNYAQALKWYLLAAEQGEAVAQYNLGNRYRNGRGVRRQNYLEALKWYRLAAEQGLADAQFSLGLMYDNGEGVMRDFVQAYKWYNLAALRFPITQRVRRDRAVNRREIVAAKMTPAQIAEAEMLVRDWMPK